MLQKLKMLQVRGIQGRRCNPPEIAQRLRNKQSETMSEDAMEKLSRQAGFCGLNKI